MVLSDGAVAIFIGVRPGRYGEVPGGVILYLVIYATATGATYDLATNSLTLLYQ